MNIVRLYNQNRRKVWRAIIIIASFIILIQVLNYFVKRDNSNNNEKYQNNANTNSQQTSNLTIESNTSAVTGGNVSNSKLENTDKILKQFFEYCNNKDLQKAYDMLTNECKEVVYPNIKIFEKNYYNNIFNGMKKNYSFANWNGNTYLVTITEDVLASGNINGTKLKDYITVKDEKLNISSYIGREQLNVVDTVKDIEFNVVYKDIYMDYEVYNIEVKNITQKEVCLSTVNNSNDVCITDENGITYGIYNHELSEQQLRVKPGVSKTFKFKFYSSYISTKEINKITFSNVILDYSKYLEYKDLYQDVDSDNEEDKVETYKLDVVLKK